MGAFPDWEQLDAAPPATRAGELELRCAGNSHVVSIDRAVRPNCGGPFRANTLVRSHSLDDYSGRAVISYSGARHPRRAQVDLPAGRRCLACPPGSGQDRARGPVNRELLQGLLGGLAVTGVRRGVESCGQICATPEACHGRHTVCPARAPNLDAEGLPSPRPPNDAENSVALPFSVFHHMPTPPREKISRLPPTSTSCSTSTRRSAR